MQISELGRTKLEVTKLSYGAMELRGKRVWYGMERILLTNRQTQY